MEISLLLYYVIELFSTIGDPKFLSLASSTQLPSSHRPKKKKEEEWCKILFFLVIIRFK